MKRIVWLESAKLDLIQIQAYYAENASPEIANKLLKRIFESASTLIGQPLIGVGTMDDDILEWHLPGLNYTLPYLIHGDHIEILRVCHLAIISKLKILIQFNPKYTAAFSVQFSPFSLAILKRFENNRLFNA